MNCFNHPETPAVGICVSCNKGACVSCIQKEAQELLCTACAQNPVKRSTTSGASYSRNWQRYVRPLFLIVFGLVYILVLGLMGTHKNIPNIVLGSVFVIYGGVLFYVAYRRTEIQDDDILDR